MAVDGSGNGITYSQPVATLSQLTWDASSGLPLVIADGADYYVYGPGTTPVEQVSLASSTATFLTYTPDSSTYVATNAAGDVVGFWGYDAYGNLSYGTPVSAFDYAGQYSDQASGLSNMRARFYQSQTGGFTTRDPGFALTDAAYGYANGDGVNSTDPTGLGGGVGAYPAADWKQEIAAEEGGPSILSFYVHLVISPFTAVYRTAVNIYQNGANSCGFLSTKNLEDTGGFVAIWTSDAFAAYAAGVAAGGSTLSVDFVASSDGTVISTSRASLEGGFKAAGFPSQPTTAAGTEYELPDGTLVRVMEPSGNAPLRASFTNSDGGPINPFTGKPVQPLPGMSPVERLAYIRSLTHLELGP